MGIFIVVLIILFLFFWGAKVLPKLGRSLGRSVGKFEKGMHDSPKTIRMPPPLNKSTIKLVKDDFTSMPPPLKGASKGRGLAMAGLIIGVCVLIFFWLAGKMITDNPVPSYNSNSEFPAGAAEQGDLAKAELDLKIIGQNSYIGRLLAHVLYQHQLGNVSDEEWREVEAINAGGSSIALAIKIDSILARLSGGISQNSDNKSTQIVLSEGQIFTGSLRELILIRKGVYDERDDESDLVWEFNRNGSLFVAPLSTLEAWVVNGKWAETRDGYLVVQGTTEDSVRGTSSPFQRTITGAKVISDNINSITVRFLYGN